VALVSHTDFPYCLHMNIEFDPAKNAVNRAKHGVDMTAAGWFEFDTALVWIDDREDYGEAREVAIGFIGDRLHVLVFTHRDSALRVISLRKATKKEARHYAEQA
ncbi:MAG: BrnT family toxin, partial [Rhodospirillales bacterium]|nr:BrnT family toxin [Rhodospirillales bacterium]